MVNMLFNKVLGENEKCVFYFYFKKWWNVLTNTIQQDRNRLNKIKKKIHEQNEKFNNKIVAV